MDVEARGSVVAYTLLGDMAIVTFDVYRIERTVGMKPRVVLSPDDRSKLLLYDSIPTP
jgi:hypothetical protein